MGGCGRLLVFLSLVHQEPRVMTAKARLYTREQPRDGGEHAFPAGLVSVRTQRSPDKDTSNEDCAAVIPVGEALVLAVADGVGGSRAGREASALAVTTLRNCLKDLDGDKDRLRTAIMDAMEKANQAVMDLNLGAATTLVVGEISAGQVRSYHVGDSEIISVGQRGRVKLQITAHSPTGFAVEAGLMDADEALHHDERHIISNVIGAPDMRIEVGTPVRLAVRDTVLLASDGLLDNLTVDEIIAVVRKGPLPMAADELVRQASERMSVDAPGLPSKPDDLTVVLFRSPPPGRKRRGSSQ